MHWFVEGSEWYVLKLNTKEAKIIINRVLTVKNDKIQRVKFYPHLDTTITEERDHSLELKDRIGKARYPFFIMAKIFKSRDWSLITKTPILRRYVFCVLWYGVESWTMSKACCKKLEDIDMSTYRPTLEISWADHIGNEEVLIKMGKGK